MIATERLILRNFKFTDYRDFLKFASEENVGPYFGCAESMIPLMARSYLKSSILKVLRFAIVIKETNEFVGVIELMHPHQDRFKTFEISDNSKEIGFAITKRYQNQGYVTEAAAALIKYGFETLDLSNIYACNLASNIASSKVQESCGLRVVGTHRVRKFLLDSNYEEIIERRITKEEYFSKKELSRIRKNICAFDSK